VRTRAGCYTCYETWNDVLGDIYESELNIEYDEISCFEKHTKGIGSKIMNKMGFDDKSLEKNGHGIQKPIEIYKRPRNLEDVDYEGQTSNEDIKFVKTYTSTLGESSTGSSAMN